MSLDREDLIRGLAQLVEALRERGEPGGIRIVGGAALSLRYFERRTTDDIDAKIHPAEPTLALAKEIAKANDWPEDWLNNKATQFVPVAKDPGWESLYDEDGIGIWVASAPALLAMKLKASRRGRDDDDIAELLALCEVDSEAEAEKVYEEFYPGEVLPDKAIQILTVIFTAGLPPKPDEPERPTFAS